MIVLLSLVNSTAGPLSLLDMRGLVVETGLIHSSLAHSTPAAIAGADHTVEAGRFAPFARRSGFAIFVDRPDVGMLAGAVNRL